MLRVTTLISHLLRSLGNRLEQWLFGYLLPSWASPVLATLGDVTRTRAELIAENVLLRQQLGILRRQVKRPQLTKADRVGLLFWASRLAHWRQALLIVKPETLLRWHREGFRLFWRWKIRAGKARTRLPQSTIDLIRRMATDNPLWGAERIRGELLKVGIHVAIRSIQKYLRRLRPKPAPSQSWATFVKTHAADTFACDFLPVVDVFFRHLYLYFIIELGTRRIVHVGVTNAPNQSWVAQQWREATPNGQVPRFIIRDNDSKYGHEFDQAVKASGTKVIRTPVRAPRANAVCERFLKSVRHECLDHLLILNERQLLRIAQAYVAYFNHARPHQGIRQKISCGDAARVSPAKGMVVATSVLNGLHHDYR